LEIAESDTLAQAIRANLGTWAYYLPQLEHTLLYQNGAVHGILETMAFSPDGHTVLTGGMDRTARLWDVADGTPIGILLTAAEPMHRMG